MKALVVWSLTVVAPAAAGPHPADTWEWTLESGDLWQAGNSPSADYEIISTQLTLRQEITPGIALRGGVYFIHHSQSGMTDPNPGIDALGFTPGCSWKF
jgi:hypothetical protein